MLKRWGALSVVLLCLVALSAHASASLTSSQARVLIIFNFINKYVEWPNAYSLGQTGYVNICSVGSDAVVKELEVLKQASTARLTVQISRNPTEAELPRCHVLYIATSEHLRAEGYVQLLVDHPVMLVSSAPRFLEVGGNVSLMDYTEQQGVFSKTFVRYGVNRSAFADKALRLDPDALELAAKVRN